MKKQIVTASIVGGSMFGFGIISLSDEDPLPKKDPIEKIGNSRWGRKERLLLDGGGGSSGSSGSAMNYGLPGENNSPYHDKYLNLDDESVGAHGWEPQTATFEKKGMQNGIPYRKGKITVNGSTYEFMTGGHGAGHLPKGDYQISNGRRRNTRGMVADGYGYSFDVSNSYDDRVGRTRTLLRVHPDGGSPGTMGCIGVQGDHNTQKSFYEDMQKELENNGGSYTLKVR